MGHVTFLGLLRRETLSLFHCVHRFARKFYHRREPLWIRARADVGAFTGVRILIEADWPRPWLPGVLASDASLSSDGVAQSHWKSLRWVDFPEWEDGDAVLYLLVVMLLRALAFGSTRAAVKFSGTVLVVRSLLIRKWLVHAVGETQAFQRSHLVCS